MIGLKQNVPAIQLHQTIRLPNPISGLGVSTQQFDCKIQMCRVADAQGSGSIGQRTSQHSNAAGSEFLKFFFLNVMNSWSLKPWLSPPNPRISNALMEFRKMKSCYSGVEVNSAIQPTNLLPSPELHRQVDHSHQSKHSKTFQATLNLIAGKQSHELKHQTSQPPPKVPSPHDLPWRSRKITLARTHQMHWDQEIPQIRNR